MLSIYRLIAMPATLLASLLIAGCGGSSQAPGTSSVLSQLDVKLAPPTALQAATPQFALRDSAGRLTRLSEFSGKAVLLTFIYTHCPDTCPLIVANLHNALVQLGPRAADVQIIAVSVDPKGDTPATVRAFQKLLWLQNDLFARHYVQR